VTNQKIAESIQSLCAFVLMPFDSKFDDLHKFRITAGDAEECRPEWGARESCE